MEKRCGDTVLNCNERWGHCSSLQWWPTAMQWGCLGQGIALQYNAMKPMSESGGISFLFALPNQNADHFAPERIRITQVGSFYEPLVVVQTVVT